MLIAAAVHGEKVHHFTHDPQDDIMQRITSQRHILTEEEPINTHTIDHVHVDGPKSFSFAFSCQVMLPAASSVSSVLIMEEPGK